MFSLVYGFAELMLQKEELHILVLGLDKAGKTNVVERLKTLLTDAVGLDAPRITPTVGLNITRIEAFGAHLVAWDLGGAPGLRAIWDKYYSDTHAVVFVVDAANPDRLEEAKAALSRVLAAPALGGAPVLVLANKQDVPGALDMGELAAAFGVSGGGAGTGGPIIVQPACAHSGQGLSDGLKWLVEALRRSPRRRLVVSRGR